MELTTVQATELSIRLGALLANHIFQLDSLEALDITTAMGVLDSSINVVAEVDWETARAVQDLDELECGIEEIGIELGSRYKTVDDILEDVISMKRKIAEFERVYDH